MAIRILKSDEEIKADMRDRRFSELYWNLLLRISEVDSWEQFQPLKKCSDDLIKKMEELQDPEASKIITFN